MIEYDEDTIPLQEIRARRIARELVEEIDRAYAKHGRLQWSRHGVYGVLLEEFEESMEAFRFRFLVPRQIRRIWRNIRSDRDQAELRKEIIQLAAVCFRYLETGDRYREPAETPPMSEPQRPFMLITREQ